MGTDVTLNLLILALLVLANAFFVAAEYALVRVRRTRIEELIQEGSSGARLVKDTVERLSDYISSIQVGVTLASLGVGWVGEPFVASLLLPLCQAILPGKLASASAHAFSFTAALLVIAFFTVIIGEIIPKSVALQFPDRVSVYLIRPLRFFTLICWPLVWLLNAVSGGIMGVFGVKLAGARSLALSEDELLLVLSESQKAGVVSREEQRMVQRVFKFYDKIVREIMTPPPDIAGLELHASEQEIKRAFEQGYSRLPVYDRDLNNVKGIVYVKDLMYTMQDPKLIKLVDLLREAMFVPETMAVSALLKDFQKNKMHMAIVVDEFGETAGLVTLEDVIEEIVGEIQDEYDHEPAEVQRAAGGTLIFEGRTSLARFKEILPQFEVPEGSYETVAGLVFRLAGRVPKEGDVLEHGGLAFTILKREGRRLRKIGVRRLPPKQPAANRDRGDTGEVEPVGRAAGDERAYAHDVPLPPEASSHLASDEDIPSARPDDEHAADDTPLPIPSESPRKSSVRRDRPIR